MVGNTYRINNLYTKMIILILLVNTLFSERGDFISSAILATRNVNNNQAYIDAELVNVDT